MKKPEKPKTDNLRWIMAFLFPKKGKPLTPPKQGLTRVPPTAQPAAAKGAVPPQPAPAPQQADAVKPMVKPAPQVIHSVTAPTQPPASTKTVATPPQADAIKPPVKPAPTQPPFPSKTVATPPPPASQSQLVRLSPKAASKRKPIFELGKTLPAFWTVASALSMIVNVILIVVLVIVARELFVLKSMVGDYLLGGLYANFIYMDKAHIKTNITVADTIPISFTLPISQDTVVKLTQNTPINGANVKITSGGLTINSAANIVLPAGTNLPVHLELNVPVTTTVPIKLNVPVDIPLEQTELHQPFVGLQQVVSPFYWMLKPKGTPIRTAADVGACKSISWLCNWIFYAP